MNLVDPGEKVNSITFSTMPDMEYSVKTKIVYKKDYGDFSMTGRLRHAKSRGQKKDIFNLLFSCSRAAGILFDKMKDSRCPDTGKVTMKEWNELTSGQLRSKYDQVKELIEKDILIKVEEIDNHVPKPPRFTYMINPYLIIPWEPGTARNLWKLLGGSIT
jgi:hypothetical protein